MSLELDRPVKENSLFSKRFFSVLKIVFLILSFGIALFGSFLSLNEYVIVVFFGFLNIVDFFHFLKTPIEIGIYPCIFLFLLFISTIVVLIYYFLKWFLQKISFWEFCEKNDQFLIFISPSILVMAIFSVDLAFMLRLRPFIPCLYFVFGIFNSLSLGFFIWQMSRGLKQCKPGVKVFIYILFLLFIPLFLLTILYLFLNAFNILNPEKFLSFLSPLYFFFVILNLFFLGLVVWHLLKKIQHFKIWKKVFIYLVLILLLPIFILTVLSLTISSILFSLSFIFFTFIWLFCVHQVFPRHKNITLLTAIPFYMAFITPVLIVFATFFILCINIKHTITPYFSSQETLKTGEIVYCIEDLGPFLNPHRDSWFFLMTRYDFSYYIQSYFSQWQLGYLHPLKLSEKGNKTSFLIRIQKNSNYEFNLVFEENKTWSKEKKDQFNKMIKDRISSQSLVNLRLKIVELTPFVSKTIVDMLIDKNVALSYYYSDSFFSNTVLWFLGFQPHDLQPGVYRIEIENLEPCLEEIDGRSFIQIRQQPYIKEIFSFK